MGDPELRILSLCSGGAGLDLGVELAMACARVVCYVEREAFAVDFLANLVEAGCLPFAPIWTNLKTFDGSAWRGAVDCVTAGYPCQPFSVAGKRRGARDPRHLWPDVARVFVETGAEFLFVENVAAHLHLGGREVIDELLGMGCRVAADIFTASEVGASHRRERLFILAHNERERSRETTAAETRWRPNADINITELAHRRSARPQGDEDEGPATRATRRSGGEEVEQPLRCGFGRQVTKLKSNDDGVSGDALRSGETVDDSANGRPAIEKSRSESRRGSREVADAEQERICKTQAGRSRDARGGVAAITGAGHLPLFPPGPGQLDEWRRVLEIEPSLEPAICGVVDGLAVGDRRHWLRMLGNGVVPLQAAYAFCALWSDLFADDE